MSTLATSREPWSEDLVPSRGGTRPSAPPGGDRGAGHAPGERLIGLGAGDRAAGSRAKEEGHQGVSRALSGPAGGRPEGQREMDRLEVSRSDGGWVGAEGDGPWTRASGGPVGVPGGQIRTGGKEGKGGRGDGGEERGLSSVARTRSAVSTQGLRAEPAPAPKRSEPPLCPVAHNSQASSCSPSFNCRLCLVMRPEGNGNI